MTEDNKIFVGQKPLMNYVNATQMQLKSNSEVMIVARGRNISKAVDIAEIICKKFMEGQVSIDSIKSDSEEMESKEKGGKKMSVSCIEIVLKK